MKSNMKISDIVLISDVDGTLLHGNEEIPQKNIDALIRFTNGGGRFGIATGRSLDYASIVVDKFPVNLPTILNNGCTLYDFSNKQYLFEKFLPDVAKEYVIEIQNKFPEVSIYVVDRDKYYDVSFEKSFSLSSRNKDMMRFVDKCEFKDLGNLCYKVVFVSQKDTAIHTYVSERKFEGVDFVFSSHSLMEMLPKNTSKGTALEVLMNHIPFKHSQLVTIGDYFNDLDMIKIAGLGVSLIDSPEEVKKHASLIVCKCSDGALSELVEYLEKTYGY